jgi:hypothetical protein
MAINRPSQDSDRRLSDDEINVVKKNLRDFRVQIRDFLTDISERDPEDIKDEVESAPMPDPFD